jgi:glutamate synthase (ferredoxin)
MENPQQGQDIPARQGIGGFPGLPHRQGLYDPRFEHDACGIGMLVNVQGKKSHKLVEDAIEVLKNLTHRGGVGSEPETGDGAGILLQIPHEFMKRVMEGEGVTLPNEGEYGVAMMFASPDSERCDKTVASFCVIVAREGMQVLGTRAVPVYEDCLGKTAGEVRPSIRQVFIAKPDGASEDDFERALYIVSKRAQAEIRRAQTEPDLYFYLTGISCRTIVYKGMLLPSQMSAFYPDLRDTGLVSAIALVHSRFSTNTFPSWERAHPLRLLMHNGEINTIRGNVNWVKAREAMLESKVFGEDLRRVLPVINEDGSDSAMLDDFLSLLMHAGRSLPEAMMMTIPEPWQNRDDMDAEKKAFYEYVNCLLEPWDGPAAVAFTDGRVAGATLDRNGLRPARYCLTKDGLLILSSEAGVLPIAPSEIVKKDRLHPGRMLLIDTVRKRIIEDDELKSRVASAKPYRRWLERNLTELDKLPAGRKQGATWQDVIRSRKRNAGEPYEQVLLKNLAGLDLLMTNKESDAK